MGQSRAVHIVDNTYGKMILRRILLHIFKYVVYVRRPDIFPTDSNTAADYDRLNVGIIESRLDVHIQRLRLGIDFFYAI